MGFIIIKKINNKIILENENGKSSREWGPRMSHKGTNIYSLAIKILNHLDQVKIDYDGDTSYIIIQPDLFLLSLIHKMDSKKGGVKWEN